MEQKYIGVHIITEWNTINQMERFSMLLENLGRLLGGQMLEVIIIGLIIGIPVIIAEEIYQRNKRN